MLQKVVNNLFRKAVKNSDGTVGYTMDMSKSIGTAMGGAFAISDYNESRDNGNGVISSALLVVMAPPWPAPTFSVIFLSHSLIEMGFMFSSPPIRWKDAAVVAYSCKPFKSASLSKEVNTIVPDMPLLPLEKERGSALPIV